MNNSKWMFLVTCLVAIIKYHKAVPVPDTNQIKSIKDTSLELNDLDSASSDEAGFSVKQSTPKPNPTRGKRTVGFLRTLFPQLSQIIDRKIQQITRVLFRVIGRLVLRGGNGGGGGGDDDKEGRKISITLPTYPPSEEDEEDTEAPSEDGDSDTEATELTTTPESESEISSLESADNSIAESQAITKIARKARDVAKPASQEINDELEQSQNINDVDQFNISDDKSNENLGKSTKQEDDGKSKRQFFKFGNTNGASGNFLFDLIRILNH